MKVTVYKSVTVVEMVPDDTKIPEVAKAAILGIQPFFQTPPPISFLYTAPHTVFQYGLTSPGARILFCFAHLIYLFRSQGILFHIHGNFAFLSDTHPR